MNKKTKRGAKVIYTKFSCCALCKERVEQYAESNKTRTVKSWMYICLKCYKKLIKS